MEIHAQQAAMLSSTSSVQMNVSMYLANRGQHYSSAMTAVAGLHVQE